jgi:uncharacterized protein (TIGR02271 family)
MANTASNSITALFQSKAAAQSAIDALIAEGVPENTIRLMPGYENEGGLKTADGDQVHSGFWKSLSDFFMPAEDRYSYAEGLSRGGYLVVVSDLTEARYSTALDILDDKGALDLDQQEQEWRQAGWGGYDASTYAGDRTTATLSDTESVTGEEVIPVIEEQLKVGKRDVSHGRVRVRSYVVETPVAEQVGLREESVRVERRPVDRPLAVGDVAFQDRTIELEERAEEAVVEKTARVVEEIGLSKDTTTRQETVSDSVKRTEVEVEDERGNVTRTGTNQ